MQKCEFLNMRKHYIFIFILTIIIAVSCSPTKFVPEGSYLLDEVTIKSNRKDISSQEMKSYLRQHPNSKWFSLVKIPLYTYSLAGKDSTKLFNKFLKRIGEAPVIFSEDDAIKSKQEIDKAVTNMGYIRSDVEMVMNINKKKLKLNYNITAEKPYTIETIKLNCADKNIYKILTKDSTSSIIKKGMNFNINKLDIERTNITSQLNNSGYYKFNKDYISFTADTILNTYKVGLTYNILPYKKDNDTIIYKHPIYKIRNVFFLTDIKEIINTDNNKDSNFKTLEKNDYKFIFKDKIFVKPGVLIDNTYIKSNELYNENNLEKTYQALGRLPALKYSNIYFRENETSDSTFLDCFIMLNKNKLKTFSLELEGTNSAGDFGAAASATFQHRNIFHGSETFTFKVRGAYEAISGLGDGFLNDNYTEYGIETSLNFPRFLMPFISSEFKKKTRATSEVGLMFTSQFRPEFERTLASVSWRYKWLHNRNYQHRVDLIDINYVYVPWISNSFKEQLEKETSSVLKYSYENLFIIRTAYNFNFNNRGSSQQPLGGINDSYNIRIGFESAGNLLYGISNIFKLQKTDNKYSIFRIPYAQYVKGDFDYVKNARIDDRNSFVFHIGVGIAYPYGNSEILPFEKRYFSGGANSVRGWSVRSLGPGSMKPRSNEIDFMLQSGDIKFDFNIEYRTRLFWKLHGAAYIDAGNIWTIRNYVDQPGGQFNIKHFYKEIAVSYGLGLRFDFDFFVLRFDTGMKAINPAETGKDKFSIISPNFKRDFAFHFAVGYPF